MKRGEIATWLATVAITVNVVVVGTKVATIIPPQDLPDREVQTPDGFTHEFTDHLSLSPTNNYILFSNYTSFSGSVSPSPSASPSAEYFD